MKSSVSFSFSPNGECLIKCCAWCKPNSINLILQKDFPFNIGNFEFQVTHGICEFHSNAMKNDFQYFAIGINRLF